jgi:hypothetical protein
MFIADFDIRTTEISELNTRGSWLIYPRLLVKAKKHAAKRFNGAVQIAKT